MSWTGTAFAASAKRRQIILDFLLTHPGAMMGEIRAAVRSTGDNGHISNTLCTMIDWGEARREGDRLTRRYFALKATTRSSSEAMAICTSRLGSVNKKAPSETTEWRSHYIHKPGNPIPNQGGQGLATGPRMVSAILGE